MDSSTQTNIGGVKGASCVRKLFTNPKHFTFTFFFYP